MSGGADNLRRDGAVVPAQPLAIDEAGKFNAEEQARLSRYYRAAGATGLAVGVHTTQFILHEDRSLLREVLEIGAHAASGLTLVAGVLGATEQAVDEASLARECGYDAVLLSGVGAAESTESELLERAAAVAEQLPVVGFYLQESVGGRPMSRRFWSSLFEIEGVVGVKVAPFDRYRSLDVAVAALESDRWADLTLLTGNDDTIVHDLITPYRRTVNGQMRERYLSGGLLGQWAVGTRSAVRLTTELMAARGSAVSSEHLAIATALVEVNAAIFDVDNNFAGCVAGVNELLRQQGLLTSSASLRGRERLSPDQSERIEEARRRFPHLLDEDFVATFLASEDGALDVRR